MGMRITTGMSMNLYRYNLQNSTLRLHNSSTMVQTQRKFNSFGESPAAATQAWRVRRAIVNTGIYLSNNSDTYSRFNIAWATLGQASHDLTDLDGRSADIFAASDPSASGRPALGLVLRQTAESVIQTINGAKAGDNFLFAGNDELNAPFTWGTDPWGNEALLYRGVNVNSGGVHVPSEDPVPDRWGEIDPVTNLPSKMPNNPTSLADKEWKAYYEAKAEYDEAQKEYEAYWEDFQAYLEALEAYTKAKTAHNLDPVNNPDPGDPPERPEVVEKPEFTYPSPADWENPFADDTDLDDYRTPKAAYKLLHNLKDLDTDDPATKAKIAWAEYYVDQGNYKKLVEMSKEEVPVDLGMGMLEDDNGKLVDGTYYNRALPGINMLGFGIDEDGDPKNVCMIMKRLGEIYSNCDPNTGAYSNNPEEAKALYKEAMRLLDKLKAGQSDVSNKYTEVSAKASFLTQNESRLDLQASYLNEELVQIEDVDEADAINQFMWDYYCYNAALKIGTQLLSQSLIDYMS